MWSLDRSCVAIYALGIRGQAMIVPCGPADHGLRQLAPGGERHAQHGPARHTPVAECPARMVLGGIVLAPVRFIQCWIPPVPSCRWVSLGSLPPVVPGYVPRGPGFLRMSQECLLLVTLLLGWFLSGLRFIPCDFCFPSTCSACLVPLELASC